MLVDPMPSWHQHWTTSMLTHSQVELLSWKSNKDLTGDGGIIKTITREGEGWDHAKNKDEVVGERSTRPNAFGACCGAPLLDVFRLPFPRPNSKTSRCGSWHPQVQWMQGCRCQSVPPTLTAS